MIFNMVGGGSGGDIDKSQIIVTAESGSTVTCTNGTDVQTASEDNGTWRFTGLDNGDWTVTATKGDMSASKTVTIDRLTVLYISIVYRLVPDFTYTGEYALVNDDDTELTDMEGNWKLRLLTSGTLTFTEVYGWDGAADVFLVGGGGGGGKGDSTLGRGCGGGGGYTMTSQVDSVQAGVEYIIEIGGGGAANSDGGSTSAFNIVAEGGKKGGTGGTSGGAGGSGGGGCGGNGGSDGSDGFSGTYHSPEPGGNGQGTTTREFGESDGTLYAGGGGGNAWGGSTTNFGIGGEGGGGDGKGSIAAESGTTNTGGGGGATTGAGGSGIVVIRNRREVAA